MRKKHAPYVTVEVGADGHQWSYWLCAAALEPALPTWLGPVWGEVMVGRFGREPDILTITVTREVWQWLTAYDHPSAAPYIAQAFLSQQAIEVLARHGLQPIPDPRLCETDDFIPF